MTVALSPLTSLDMEELILRWLAYRPGSTMTDLDARFPFGRRPGDEELSLVSLTVDSLLRQGWVRRRPVADTYYRYTPTPAGRWPTTFDLSDRLAPWWPGPTPFEQLAAQEPTR